MCSVSSDVPEMQFTIHERGAGRKEFFRQREEQQRMATADEAQRALDEMLDHMGYFANPRV